MFDTVNIPNTIPPSEVSECMQWCASQPSGVDIKKLIACNERCFLRYLKSVVKDKNDVRVPWLDPVCPNGAGACSTSSQRQV